MTDRFAGLDVADFVDEGAEDGRAVGMFLAIGFDGTTQTGVTGINEESKKHVSVYIMKNEK